MLKKNSLRVFVGTIIFFVVVSYFFPDMFGLFLLVIISPVALVSLLLYIFSYFREKQNSQQLTADVLTLETGSKEFSLKRVGKMLLFIITPLYLLAVSWEPIKMFALFVVVFFGYQP